MSNLATPIGGPLGLCRTMRDVITALVDSSRELTAALMHRQVDACWALMAQQEKLSAEFHQHMQMWQSLFANHPAAEQGEVVRERSHLRESIHELQHLARTNAALSRGFSGAIRRALEGLGAAPARRGSVYNRLGRVPSGKTSVLVRQVG